jgi:hypothetical protein
MKQICCSAFAEGTSDQLGIVGSANTRTTQIAVAATPVPVIGIRLKSAYARGQIIPIESEMMTTSGFNCLIEVWARATITGGAWVSASNGVEANITGASVSTASAFRIATGLTTANTARSAIQQLSNAIPICSDFSGTQDQLVVVMTGIAGSSGNVSADITWQELY